MWTTALSATVHCSTTLDPISSYPIGSGVGLLAKRSARPWLTLRQLLTTSPPARQ
jgi:hypothetical protein